MTASAATTARGALPASGDAPRPERPQGNPRPVVEEIHATPAGVFARGLARLIDLICLSCLWALALLLAQAVAGTQLLDVAHMKRFALPLGGLFCALTFAYTALFHALGGRTPGKWVLGLHVLDQAGQPPALNRSALRALLAFVSAAPLFLGFAVALFSRRRQSFHDKATGTYVVRLIEPRRPGRGAM